MILVSYIPLLTPPAGIVKPPEEKEDLVRMLNDAAESYPIQAIAWIQDRDHFYPLLIMPYALEIQRHILKWSGNKPENYFTFVWNTLGPNGYSVALLPNFEKSARRWRALNNSQERITVLGHLFTYSVTQSAGSFSRHLLEGLERIRVGFTSKIPTLDTDLEDYSEITMRVRNYAALNAEERGMLAPYFTTPEKQQPPHH